VALLALDGQDIRQSEMLLVAPFEPENLDLPERSGRWTTVCGDFYEGEWRTLEQFSLGKEHCLEIDEDRATCLILICRPERGPAAMSR
jgi:hypothetical protein